MSSQIFGLLFSLFMVMSGGPSNHDLLDMVPSDSYWRVAGVTVTAAQLREDATGAAKAAGDVAGAVKDLSSPEFARRGAAKRTLEAAGTLALPALKVAKESKDPEVSAAAMELIERLTSHVKDREIRQLMAIRALGERKEAGAAAQLHGLEGSTAPFVAAYARRAISAIEGTPLKRVDRMAELKADLALLPADTGIAGQTTGLGLPGFTLEKIVRAAVEGQKARGGADPGPVNVEAATDRLTREVLVYANRVGNIRADGVTVGVAKEIGERNWVVMSFRGEYDAHAVAALVEEMTKKENNQFFEIAPFKIGEMDALQLAHEATVIFVSDHQLVFAVVEDRKTPALSVMLPVVMGLMSGKPSIAAGSEIDRLIQGTDKTGPVWAAGMPSKMMAREMPFVAPFETLSLSSKQEKEGVTLKLNAVSGGGVLAHAAAATVEVMVKKMLPEVEAEAAKEAALLPVVKALKSLKMEAVETGVKATAVVPADLGEGMLYVLGREMGGSVLEGAPETPLPQK